MVLRFFMLAGIFFFVSCSDVERSNPDDPGGNNYKGGVSYSSSSTSVWRSSSSAAVSSSSVAVSSSSVALSSSSSTSARKLICNITENPKESEYTDRFNPFESSEDIIDVKCAKIEDETDFVSLNDNNAGIDLLDNEGNKIYILSGGKIAGTYSFSVKVTKTLLPQKECIGLEAECGTLVLCYKGCPSSSSTTPPSSSSVVSSSSSAVVSSSSSTPSCSSSAPPSSSSVAPSSSSAAVSSSSSTPSSSSSVPPPSSSSCTANDNTSTLYCSNGTMKEYGFVTHGGQKYKTVVIGTQTWMAENLNYNANGSKCGDESTGKLSDANTATCDTYGRMYNWTTAMTACPSDWHLPSGADWNALTATVGEETAGKYLKAKSGWNSSYGEISGNGMDIYGFSALPGGFGGSGGRFYDFGYYGSWWSSSENGIVNAYSRHICYVCESVDLGNYSKSGSLFSVRCVKD